MAPVKPTFKEAFAFWLKLGFISFGGPAGQIAIMHEFLVEKKKWISESRFLHALNYCMLLPGPEAQQLAIYTGKMLHGIRGGLAAGILFVLPSMLFLWMLSAAYVYFGKIPMIVSLFDGLKPAVVAIVLTALWKIAKKSLKSQAEVAAAVISFLMLFFLNINFVVIILLALLGGVIRSVVLNRKGKAVPTAAASRHAVVEEEAFVINKFTPSDGIRFTWKSLFIQSLVFVTLWLLPYGYCYMFSGEQFPFWNRLILLFTSAAFVTFGGAYAVLPYIAQVSVEKLNWLSSAQMVDGLALGETTPGPLIMVLTFVGFMGAWNQLGQSLPMATIGLLLTTWYTFLPCFLFIFAGAPLIEMSRQSDRIRPMMQYVSAAVTGVVLNLALFFGQAVVFSGKVNLHSLNVPALCWVLISLYALQKLKIHMITWILISALAGLLFFLANRFLLN